MKNLRNEKGVSLMSLVIVIMIMGIIFAVTFNSGKELLDTTKVKKYATVMYLVKAEVEAIVDEYDFLAYDEYPNGVFNTTISNKNKEIKNKMFVGKEITLTDTTDIMMLNEIYDILASEINVTEYNKYYSSASTEYYDKVKKAWRIVDKDDLRAWGINEDFVNDVDKVFYVNYITAEVLYKKGISIDIVDPITGETDKKVIHALRTFESL